MGLMKFFDVLIVIFVAIISVLLLVLGIWMLYRCFTKFSATKRKMMNEDWLEYKSSREIYSNDDITEGACLEFAEYTSRSIIGLIQTMVIMGIVAVGMIILGGGVVLSFISSIG